MRRSSRCPAPLTVCVRSVVQRTPQWCSPQWTPANPYGAVLAWPKLAGRAARAAGSFVVLHSGELRLYIERGGRSMLTCGDVGDEDIDALTTVAARIGRLDLQTIDGDPAAAHHLAPRLRAGGFVPSPRGLVVYPHRPGRVHARVDARG